MKIIKIILLSTLLFLTIKPYFPFGFASDEGPYFSVGFNDNENNQDNDQDSNNPDYFYTYGKYNTPYYKPRYNNLLMYEYGSKLDDKY